MRKFQKCLILVFLGLSPYILKAQNELSVSPVTVGTETGFQLSVSLENQVEVAAVQFDINLNKDSFQLATGHQLSTRAVNHEIGVNLVSPGVLRVIIYATDGSLIPVGTGKLVDLNLKSKNLPGSYTATISNIVASDSSGSSLTFTSQSDEVTITGPQLHVTTTTVDFGRVPLNTSPTGSLTISNPGNETLTINSFSGISPFSIQQSFPFDIAGGQSTTLTVAVNTTQKQNITRELTFDTNDPDPLRKLQNTVIKADIYAVNEIHIGSGSGEINTEVTIPVTIKNMEPFTGFQFDITLPTDIAYVENSIINSARNNGHSVSASRVNQNTLRFIGYSSSNDFFSGNDGEVFSFKLKPNISSGNYQLHISNALISHPEMGNILSDTYGGSIGINAPRFSVYPYSINFDSVPITETRTQSIRISNYGSAPLIIDTLLYDQSQLNLDAVLPIEIPVYDNRNLSVTYTPSKTGDFSENIIFRHNGPTEQNTISVSAQVFSPNYLLIQEQNVYQKSSATVQLDLVNNDSLRALQFDIKFPTGFTFDKEKLTTTGRVSGFSVSSSEVSENVFRILVFSDSGTVIEPGESTILHLPVFIEETVALGSYPLDFTEVVLSDNSYKNITSSALKTGRLNIIEDNTLPEAVCQNIIVHLDASGNAVITAQQIDNGSTDASGIASISVSPSTFTTDNLGDNTVILTVTDNNGNTNTCAATVTVKEPLNIQAVCQDIPLQLDADGLATLTAEQIDNGSHAAAGIASMTISPSDFSTENMGANEVTLTVTDNEGNTTSCTAVVTVEAETTAPTAVCQDISVELDENGQAIVTAAQIDNGSSDASGIGSMTISPSTFTMDNLGDNTVTLTVTDKNGNSNTCTAVVSVATESTAPTAVCQNISVELDENGQALITAEQINNGSSDASGIASMTISPSTFSIDNLGDNPVTLTVTDNNGNTGTCEATVTVKEPINIQAVCQDVSLQLDADGLATITADQIDNGSNAAAGIASKTISPSSFTTENLGANEVTLTVTDNNGVTAFCSATVTVENFAANYILIADQNMNIADTTNVSFQLINSEPIKAVQFDLELPAGFDPDVESVTANERISGFSQSVKSISENKYRVLVYSTSGLSIASGEGTIIDLPIYTNSEVALGIYTPVISSILLSGLDNQNAATPPKKTGSLTVVDTIAPTAVCKNITVQLDANGKATIAAEDIDNGSNDAAGIASLSLSKSSFSLEHVGPNEVVLTVTDNNGNTGSCSATVTVEDNIAPEAICQNISVELSANGEATIIAEQIDNGSKDASGINSMTVSPSSFSMENIGSNEVTLVVTDNNGVTAFCSATVTVEEFAANYILIADKNMNEGDTTNVSIQLINSEPVKALQFDVEFPAGFEPDLEAAAATDRMSGFSKTVSFLNGNKYRILVYSTSGLSIASGEGAIINLPTYVNSEVALGIYTPVISGVLLSDLDNQNIATAPLKTGTLTVVDTIAPTAVCQDITLQLDANGQANITAAQIDNGSNDASGIASLSLSQSSFVVEHVGTNKVILTVTDNNGNTSTCNALVTVEDNVAPKAICQNIPVQLDANGQATITAEQIDNGSNDASGIASLSLSQSSFSVEHVGPNEVILTVTDNNGNTSRCTAIIMVEDNVVPEAICKNITLQLDINGELTITADQVDNGSSDAAGIASMDISPSTFTIDNLGENTVNLTVQDNNGNTDTCSAIATIVEYDKTPPVPDEPILQNIVEECAVPSIPVPTATDNVDGSISGKTNDPLTYQEQGTYTITWIFEDVNGNREIQEQKVIIEDLIDPVVEVKEVTKKLTQGGVVEFQAQELDNGSSDNCGEIILTLDRTSFDAVGEYTVELTATDAAGNQSSKSTTVFIEHDIQPEKVHIIPTLIEKGSTVKVYVPLGTNIKEVHIIETETNRFKSFPGNNQDTLELNVAPLTGTLLVKIIDGNDKTHFKKLIVL